MKPKLKDLLRPNKPELVSDRLDLVGQMDELAHNAQALAQALGEMGVTETGDEPTEE